jgi:hypothetical protein
MERIMDAKQKKPYFKKDMHFDEFKKMFSEENNIFLREARLIPLAGAGDEMALTSVFLSALRLIEEFRKLISRDIEISSSGNIHVFTEISFGVENPDKLKRDSTKRIDGMIVVERGSKIKDIVLLEVKNKNNEIDSKQIEEYVQIAKEYGIFKLTTISNQFVTNPKEIPINIKVPKNFELYHLSWSYILTLANILLFDNDLNISDKEQVEIMKEVVEYFKHAGVSGYTQMKKGWRIVAEDIPKNVKSKDIDIFETVESWLQEEKDMALVLSSEIGSLVQTGDKKFKNDPSGRLRNETKKLTEEKKLQSTFVIKNAAAPIEVEVNFESAKVEMKTTIQADETSPTPTGQLGWLKRLFKSCENIATKDKEHPFNYLKEHLYVEAKYKNKKSCSKTRHSYSDMDAIVENVCKSESITEFTVIYINPMGAKFKSGQKFIQEIEKMLLDFYGGVVQNMKNGAKKIPAIKEEIKQ